MVHKPPLAANVVLPKSIGEWTLDPESAKNGHTWYGPNGETSVGVFASAGSVYVKVMDERCHGLERGERTFETEIPDEGDHQAVKKELVADAVTAAINWMESHEPTAWSCDAVNESVFDPPAGYQLAFYDVGLQSSIIYYHRTGREQRTVLGSGRPPEDLTLENCPYLVIETYRGSGNTTVSLSPWKRAHDDEMREVVDTPEECGLDVGLSMARQFIRENVEDVATQPPSIGQSDLGAFS